MRRLNRCSRGVGCLPSDVRTPTDPRASSRVRCFVVADARTLFVFRSVLLLVRLLRQCFFLVPITARGLTGRRRGFRICHVNRYPSPAEWSEPPTSTYYTP